MSGHGHLLSRMMKWALLKMTTPTILIMMSLMEEMQADAAAANEERTKAGYESIAIVGWASKPYYDSEKKVLHWAKEIKFGETDGTTLNYNVRILGRKGVIVLNAVASMLQLPDVKQNIEPVLASFSYSDGNKYADFNPELDEVAAWTIGGLVAGKVLAKAGILALLLKNIKLILLAIGGLGTGIWRWYKKKTEDACGQKIRRLRIKLSHEIAISYNR